LQKAGLFKETLLVSTLALATETIDYTLPGVAPFTRVLDRSRDNLGRDIGWNMARGRNGALVCAVPPSEPDWRFSRIMLPCLNCSFTISSPPPKHRLDKRDGIG